MRKTPISTLVASLLFTPLIHAAPQSNHDSNSGQREGTAAGRDALGTSAAGENVALGLGSGDVTPTGAFSYDLPIEVPVGRRGVAPKLAIAYDSQMGNGLMGMGWTLRGLPAVVRIPYLRGLTFDGADHYALATGGWGAPVAPGMRLVRQASGRYHTLEESWAELQPRGTCGDGPCQWIMVDGKGGTMTFGASAGSQLERVPSGNGLTGTGQRAWALSRYEDQHGNSYDVTYEKDTWMMYPKRLVYGCSTPVTPPPPTPPPPTTGIIYPNTGPSLIFGVTPTNPTPVGGIGFPPPGGSPPPVGIVITIPTATTTPTVTISTTPSSPGCDSERELVFQYQESGRPDATALPGRYERLLTAIEVYSTGRPLRAYEFGFDQTTPRTRLVRVERHGDDFDQPVPTSLPPIIIGWSGVPALPPAGSSQSTNLGNAAGTRIESLLGDVDGDGREDLVRVAHDVTQRRVAQLRGTDAGLVAWTAVANTTGNGSFRALLADVNGDGKKDLVDVYAGGASSSAQGTVEVWVALGGASGLGTPARIYSQASVVAPGSSTYTRAVPADLNGDLVTDLLVLNQETHKALFFVAARGPGNGLQTPPRLVDGGSSFSFAASPFEPIVADLNGDDFLDVVMPATSSASALTGVPARVHMLTWFGGRDTGATPVVEGPQRVVDLISESTGESGWTPYQALSGDFNGDGTGDFLLAWSGQPEQSSTPIPWGRDVRAFYGRPELGRGNGAVFASVVKESPDPPLPTADFAGSHFAFWQHHAGDLNGDGITDVVMAFHGAGGQHVQWMMGRSDGSFAPVGGLPAGGPLADGTAAAHKWITRMGDVHGDGRDDLIRAYVGNTRTIVDVFPGTSGGLGPAVRLLDIATGDGPSPTTAESAASASVLTGDVNGDGRVDLVVSGWGRVLTVTSSGGAVDKVTSVDEGVGGVTGVSYESAPRVPSAIQPAVTTCGGGSGLVCGIPNTGARQLVTRRELRIANPDGTTTTESTAYAYANGRFVPGLVEAVGAAQVRSDLGFETITRTNEQTQLLRRTRYRQLWPLARSVAVEEVELPRTPASTSRWVTRRETFTYDTASNTTAYGTVWPRLQRKRIETFEGNVAGGDVRTSYDYNATGGTIRQTECAAERPGAGDLCLETVTEYAEDETPSLLDPTSARFRWLINRPVSVRSHVEKSEVVLDWRKLRYASDDSTLVTETERLLCQEADLCECFSSPDAAACVARGDRWVMTSVQTYDLAGNLETLTDALGRTTTYGYDPTFATLVASTTRMVGTTPFVDGRTYDFAGREETATDVRGAVTTTHHDHLGRRSRLDLPNGAWETWEFLDYGVVASQRVHHVRATGAKTSASDDRYFDGRGEVYLERRSSDDARTIDVRREQYVSGGLRVVIASRPHFTGATGVMWIETEHDGLERPVAIHRKRDATRGGGGTRVATLQRTTYQPDAVVVEENQGEVNAATGAIGTPVWAATTRRVTARGKLAEIIDAAGNPTTYLYDAAQRIILVDGPGASGTQWMSFIHDSWGRTSLMADSATGETTLRHDDADRIVERQDALLQGTSYGYDELDRPIWRMSPSGLASWAYDTAANGKGRLAQVVDASGMTTTTGYDLAGNVLSRRTIIGGEVFDEKMSFDLSNRLLTLTQPNARVLGWGYSPAGRVATVTLDGVPVATYSDHDAEDRPALRVTTGGRTSYVYAPDGRLSTITTTLGATTLQSYAYRYNGRGDVLAIYDNRPSASKTSSSGVNTDDTWTFRYDALGRLTRATDAYGVVTSYGYDAAGNPTAAGPLDIVYGAREVDADSVTLSCPVTLPPTPCTATRRDVWHQWLDDAGQVTQKDNGAGTWTYGWTAEGFLRSVALGGQPQAVFVHDAAGTRRRKDLVAPGAPKTTTYHVSPSYQLRVQASARAATIHVFGPGGDLLASVTDVQLSGVDTLAAMLAAAGRALAGLPIGSPKGTMTYLTNHISSVAVAQDAAGRELSRYVYAPWGALVTGHSTGRDDAVHGFTGQGRDAESGLMDYSARAYDPETMRMLSADSELPGGGTDPQGLNRYSYALDNPVRYRDPSGHTPEEPELELRFECSLCTEAALTNAATTLLMSAGTDEATTALRWTGARFGGLDAALDMSSFGGYRSLESSLLGRGTTLLQKGLSLAIGEQRTKSLMYPIWKAASGLYAFDAGARGQKLLTLLPETLEAGKGVGHVARMIEGPAYKLGQAAMPYLQRAGTALGYLGFGLDAYGLASSLASGDYGAASMHTAGLVSNVATRVAGAASPVGKVAMSYQVGYAIGDAARRFGEWSSGGFTIADIFFMPAGFWDDGLFSF